MEKGWGKGWHKNTHFLPQTHQCGGLNNVASFYDYIVFLDSANLIGTWNQWQIIMNNTEFDAHTRDMIQRVYKKSGDKSKAVAKRADMEDYYTPALRQTVEKLYVDDYQFLQKLKRDKLPHILPPLSRFLDSLYS